MQQLTTKPKILYVDDEEDNLHVFKSTFRRHYDIITATSANEGLTLLKDNDVDIVISDQRMPRVTGVEFLNAVPNKSNRIRMIMTGYSDIETVIDALNNGKIQKYIRKPWVKEELKLIFDNALENVEQNNIKLKTSNEKKLKAENILVEPNLNGLNQRDEIESLKKQVFEAYNNVQLLSEIGQEIISTLDLETILTTVYENVNQLMDATVFGIGTYNQSLQTIDYKLAFDKGVRYKPYSRTMEDKDQFPVWCIENKKEVFINNAEIEYSKYIKSTKNLNPENAVLEDGATIEMQHSLIYMPLLIKDKIIGLITVQSYEKKAYTQYHLSALRNIAIFVATALENSLAYHLIETQKEEIEFKNQELEHKVEKRTQELRLQKDELEETFSKLKLLTEIGQEITSSLNLDKILNTIYENVNRLMDASVFGIGIYTKEENTIYYKLAIENGKRYQPYKRTMEDKDQFPVWCIENKSEIFINDVYKEYDRYISVFEEIVSTLEDGTQSLVPVSLIYMPLLFNNEVIGVITVQSFRKYAYNQYHLDILRSLGSYITTAIQNANSYSKMTEAFEQLKSAQSKLVESEKMASLGVLTAGVAHEINNPVNFISGGIGSLKENYNELKILLNLIENFDEEISVQELWEKLKSVQQEIDLKSLLPEMEILINTIENGAKRTSEIVLGLRNFSRLDESEMKRANLHEGLDSALVILNNKIKDRIDIIKDYGDIPNLVCYPGKINQVFMNILSNAADAIKDKGSINIKTWLKDAIIFITIKDTGSGMSDEIKEHVFEPFFTTKDVGKGTGLGLSISYGIIESHKGNIKVESELDKGTVFTISLPIHN